MQVEAGAVDARGGLGHEGGVHALQLGQFLDNQLGRHHVAHPPPFAGSVDIPVEAGDARRHQRQDEHPLHGQRQVAGEAQRGLLERVGSVRADHNELAVSQVDNVHQPEGQRQSQCDEQQDISNPENPCNPDDPASDDPILCRPRSGY